MTKIGRIRIADSAKGYTVQIGREDGSWQNYQRCTTKTEALAVRKELKQGILAKRGK